MDDRLQKIQLNNPIPLHFYSPEERLPEMHEMVIAIYKIDSFTECTVCRGNTVIEAVKYEEKHEDGERTIAWASFSPDWVIQQKQEE